MTNLGTFNHADRETSDNVPATALAAITRAYAKVIDDVNKLGIKEIAAPHGDGT